MKKFALTFSILFIVIFLAACGAAAPVSPFRDEMPWGTAYDAFEESEFAVRVYAFPENSDDDEILVGTGEMSHTLSATGDGQNNVITISSSRKINWLDVPEARENRNLTNLSTSEVSFRRAGLVPLSSTRTETMENRYHDDGTFWYNQSFVSRAYYADYPTAALRRTSTISFGKNAQGAWLSENYAIPIRTGPVFDNEQLSFLLRALGNFSLNAAVNLNFNNVFRNYVVGSNAFMPLRLTVGNSFMLPSFEGDDWDFLQTYIELPSEEENDEEEGAPLIPAVAVGVMLDQTPSGPMHIFYFSHPNTEFNAEGSAQTTSRVKLGYEYILTDAQAAPVFRFRHRLVGYTNRRA